MPDPAVEPEALERLMGEVSRFGATKAGGVDRPALTDAHGAARDWLCSLFREADYQCKVDAIGNVFGILDRAGPDAPLILSGSHLDSQPMGGRFDGAYGVVAAFAAIEVVRKALNERGGTPHCNFAVADWMNEEGARFQPSLLGSGVFGGEHTLDFALERRDGAGKNVADELVRTGYRGTETAPDPTAYIEMHVECGPVLEQAGRTIGPIVRYWGAVKMRVAMVGEQAHTGPTPMNKRKDALLAASHVVTALKRMSDEASDTLYTSVGRLEVEPNSPNIVPGRATMFIELRSPSAETLDSAEADLNALLKNAAAEARVEIDVLSIDRRAAGRFDDRLVSLAEREAHALGLSTLRVDTIAGHDAIPVGRRCPAIVVNVPSVGGICHNATEYTSPEDLLAGANVLVRMLMRIEEAKGDLSAMEAAT